MKNFKKLLLAGATVLATLAAPMNVFAKNVDPATVDSQETTLNYKVGSHYTWEIHSDIDFGKDGGTNATLNGTVKTGDQKVKVTENVIEEGKKLHITAHGSGTDKAFTITNGSNTVLNYAVKSGDKAVGVDGDVLDVVAGTNTGETVMDFKLSTTTDTAEKAGAYTGTITYASSVVDAQ